VVGTAREGVVFVLGGVGGKKKNGRIEGGEVRTDALTEGEVEWDVLSESEEFDGDFCGVHEGGIVIVSDERHIGHILD